MDEQENRAFPEKEELSAAEERPAGKIIPENREGKWKKRLMRTVAYLLVAALSSVLTLILYAWSGNASGGSTKLRELEKILNAMYIGQIDQTEMEDMAAAGMVAGIGDRWSYYIPASELQGHQDTMSNSYVGIGVTISRLEDGSGFSVEQVEPDGPAKKGGIVPGDVIVAVDGQRVSVVGLDEAADMVSGEENTTVEITVLRQEQELTFSLTRTRVLVQVAAGEMVTDEIGYIRISNFDDRCSEETIALMEELEKQGARGFIFDVRFNPGGYRHELVALLDYLLPEGLLFKGEDYLGRTDADYSDAACKNVPMAVLINGNSYSAAEFFAAALVEYEYAFTVGQPTTGKGYFQVTVPLSDGSAVNLSVGKYYTPNGVSLAEVGGLTPDVPVEVDEETAAAIYSKTLELTEDPQLQAAIAALQAQMQGA